MVIKSRVCHQFTLITSAIVKRLSDEMSMVTDHFDGKKFKEELGSDKSFRVGTGDIGDKLESRQVILHPGEGSKLNWEYKDWKFFPFTGKICWYVGAGWHVIGEFKEGILQNRLRWTEPPPLENH